MDFGHTKCPCLSNAAPAHLVGLPSSGGACAQDLHHICILYYTSLFFFFFFFSPQESPLFQKLDEAKTY